jgi:hypothetical protein
MIRRFNVFETQLESAVDLSDKAKLSLYKKSSNSGISVDILEEVYRRGYKCWNESFGGTADSFAFDRVNSFIAGGFAAQLDEDLLEKRGLWDNIHAKRARIKAGSGERMRKPGSKGAPTDASIKASQNEDTDPCWKGYKMVGMKKKGGRSVPNCVPVKEQLDKPTPSEKTLDKKYGKSTVSKAMKQGEKIEKEHTSSSKTAKEIARDHIKERPDYYKKLKQVEEGKIKDTVKKAARVGAVVGALGSHAGKVYDVGNVATHQDDPALAAATVASYMHPASRVLQAAPSVLRVDKAGKGENEFLRQKKFPKKIVREDAEKHSKNPNNPMSRFDASNELVKTYTKDTPGAETPAHLIKRVVRECLEEGDVIRTKLATKNLQKRGIEGPHKIGVNDFERAWATSKMPKSTDDKHYVAYHGDTARFMSDPSKGKHVDIKGGSIQSLIIDPTGSKSGIRKGIYSYGDKVKTSVVKNKTTKKTGNVVKIKEIVKEATFQGKTVSLNKPMKGDVKKSKVYVDPDGDGKAQKVNFGDKKLSIKKDQPARKRSYCARSGGIKGKSDKTSANYWSRKAWDC